VPAELGIRRDPRSLGVALRRVTLRHGSELVSLEAKDERLTVGFHDYEIADDLRWTDGWAELPAEMFAPFKAGVEIMVRLGGATKYLDYDQRPGKVAA
jgi:hypothetical protein